MDNQAKNLMGEYLFAKNPLVEVYNEISKKPEETWVYPYGFFIWYGANRNIKVHLKTKIRDEKSLALYLGGSLKVQRKISGKPDLCYDFSEKYDKIFFQGEDFIFKAISKDETLKIKEFFDKFLKKI